MSAAIIIDTETTGLDAPEVLQLAATHPMATPFDMPVLQSMFFQVTKRIDYGAMATHHRIPEDLVGCDLWPGKWDIPAGVSYVVGHNIDFDWQAIGSPNVQRICTLALALARAYFEDIDSYTLGAMTYATMPAAEARQLLRDAHDAARDVDLCWRLLHRIIDRCGAKTWPDLHAASEIARMPVRMTFGKYGPHEDWAKRNGGKGMLCREVRQRDPGYFSWLMRSCDQVTKDPYLRKALTGAA